MSGTTSTTMAEVLAEACMEFTADHDEPGVCAACGWLDHEHPAAIETTTSIAA
jgi:hypothetical protein